MSMVYLSIENVRYKFQSRRGSIALVALGKPKTRKEIGTIKFIEPIMENIIKLGPVLMRGNLPQIKWFINHFTKIINNC